MTLVLVLCRKVAEFQNSGGSRAFQNSATAPFLA